jgi:hypothetical protein
MMGSRIFWHMSNENRDSRDEPKGSAFWAGRAWLSFNSLRHIYFEWYVGRHSRHTGMTFGIRRDGERELNFFFGIAGLIGLYLAFSGFIRFRYMGADYTERTIGWSIFDGTLWLYPWIDRTGWGPRADPISINPANFFLGRRKYSQTEPTRTYVSIPMPEGTYHAYVDQYTSMWKRPRWPRVKKVERFDITLGTPIPVPGKGENSWDLDDDAVFSSCIAAKSLDEAVQRLVDDILETRRKYGGEGWKPEARG